MAVSWIRKLRDRALLGRHLREVDGTPYLRMPGNGRWYRLPPANVETLWQAALAEHRRHPVLSWVRIGQIPLLLVGFAWVMAVNILYDFTLLASTPTAIGFWFILISTGLAIAGGVRHSLALRKALSGDAERLDGPPPARD